MWEALNDPAALKACIPGCESMERIGDDEWRATVAAKVGPVSAKFSGKMRLTDIVPPTSYTLKFEGQGGAAGFANGEARVTLVPAPDDQTTLTYSARAQVGGKLAQIGSRLIDGAAAKLADDFFAQIQRAIRAGRGRWRTCDGRPRAGREHILRCALDPLRRAGADPGHHGLVVCAGRRQVLAAPVTVRKRGHSWTASISKS